MFDDVIDDGGPDPLEMPDGIYFDLDETLYHKLPRASASFLKKMDISPSDAWESSWMNPDKEDKTTDAMIAGKAAHTAQLEPELFTSQFVVKPEAEDFPNCLTNATEIANALAELGQPKTSKGENVLEKAMRLKSAGFGGKIFHIILDEWEAEKRGRHAITKATFTSIMKDSKLLRSNPEIAKLITGGYSEVSFLWTDPETKIQMKMRVDYLKACGFVDIKNFANKNGKSVGRVFIDSFMYDRHHIQAAFYFDAIEMVRRGIVDLKVNGTAEQVAMIDELKARKKPIKCKFIWLQKSGAANIACRNIALTHPVVGVLEQGQGVETEAEEMAYKHPTYTGLYYRAAGDIRSALAQYKTCLEVFEGEPWQSLDMLGEISDGDFPPFWLTLYGE